MIQQNYLHYFRVFQNDTVITAISTNDFRFSKLKPTSPLSLAPLGQLFTGYLTKALAIEGAKSGARNYIDQLIAMGDAGKELLLAYRNDHYDDLNFNLVR